MQRDEYEPLDPRPINEGGEVPAGQSGTYQPQEGESQMGQQSQEQQSGDMASKAQEQASNVAGKAQERAGNVATMAQERSNQGIDKAAKGMSSAAEQVRHRMEGKEGMQGQMGTRVADSLDRAGGYLREHDSQQIWEDVESFVKENPMQAAAGALVAGFLLGRILR